jgi:hypothetical protein
LALARVVETRGFGDLRAAGRFGVLALADFLAFLAFLATARFDRFGAFRAFFAIGIPPLTLWP